MTSIFIRGNDDQVIPILSLGGIGVISVLSNVMPAAVHDMVMEYRMEILNQHLIFSLNTWI